MCAETSSMKAHPGQHSYLLAQERPDPCVALWAFCLNGRGVCGCPSTPRVTDSVTEMLTPRLLRSPCCAVIFTLWVIFNSSHNIWRWGGDGTVGSLLFHQERHLNILGSREFQGSQEESEAAAPDLSDTSRSRGLH